MAITVPKSTEAKDRLSNSIFKFNQIGLYGVGMLVLEFINDNTQLECPFSVSIYEDILKVLTLSISLCNKKSMIKLEMSHMPRME